MRLFLDVLIGVVIEDSNILKIFFPINCELLFVNIFSIRTNQPEHTEGNPECFPLGSQNICAIYFSFAKTFAVKPLDIYSRTVSILIALYMNFLRWSERLSEIANQNHWGRTGISPSQHLQRFLQPCFAVFLFLIEIKLVIYKYGYKLKFIGKRLVLAFWELQGPLSLLPLYHLYDCSLKIIRRHVRKDAFNSFIRRNSFNFLLIAKKPLAHQKYDS